jgi:hypothetical protein
MSRMCETISSMPHYTIQENRNLPSKCRCLPSDMAMYSRQPNLLCMLCASLNFWGKCIYFCTFLFVILLVLMHCDFVFVIL